MAESVVDLDQAGIAARVLMVETVAVIHLRMTRMLLMVPELAPTAMDMVIPEVGAHMMTADLPSAVAVVMAIAVVPGGEVAATGSR